MKLAQTILIKLICLLVILDGVLLILMPVRDIMTYVEPYLPVNPILRISVGVVLVLVGLFMLLPVAWIKQRARALTFAGPHGRTRIQLKAVEGTINKAALRFAEVQKINANVIPSGDSRGVNIPADVVIRKPSGVSARHVSDLVTDYLRNEAHRLLGDEVNVTVDLNVTNIVSDEETLADQAASLLAQEPAQSAAGAAPAAAAASSAPVQERGPAEAALEEDEEPSDTPVMAVHDEEVDEEAPLDEEEEYAGTAPSEHEDLTSSIPLVEPLSPEDAAYGPVEAPERVDKGEDDPLRRHGIEEAPLVETPGEEEDPPFRLDMLPDEPEGDQEPPPRDTEDRP